MEKMFFSLKEVAEEFGVTTGCVRNWVKQGKLQAIITPGGHRRIRKDDYDEFLRKYLDTEVSVG